MSIRGAATARSSTASSSTSPGSSRRRAPTRGTPGRRPTSFRPGRTSAASPAGTSRPRPTSWTCGSTPVSHIAVLRAGEWPELVKGGSGATSGSRRPADLYVEGHDQHRGWFQSSLLTSVALYGDAPYDGVITHGFVVDGQGRKMSKSLGNVVAPQDLIQKYGADIVRLWVASLDYRDDDPISEEILARCGEAYRTLRNTARYLISNLYAFDPDADARPMDRLQPLDAWALGQAREVVRRILSAYETYELHVVYHQLVTFCATTLSAFYLDILKDRLYASAASASERRSAQTALWRIEHALAPAMATVLPFTARDI